MSERNKAIAELYKAGKTLQEIGEQYELTGERVRQIVKSIGIYRNQGGAYIKSKARMDASEKKDCNRGISDLLRSTDVLTRK